MATVMLPASPAGTNPTPAEADRQLGEALRRVGEKNARNTIYGKDYVDLIAACLPSPSFGPRHPRAAGLVYSLLTRLAAESHHLRYGQVWASSPTALALAQWSGVAAAEWLDPFRDACRQFRLEGFVSMYDADQDSQHERGLVEGLVMTGQPFALVGPEKCCKSMLAADLVAAGLAGGDFLGHPVRERFTSLILALEGSASQVRELVARALVRRGAAGEKAREAAAGVMVASDRRLLCGKKGRAALCQYLVDARVDVVVVDCLYHVFPPAAGTNLAAAGKALRGLFSRIADYCQRTAVIIHHTRELPVGQSPTLHDMAGVGLSAFAKSWLLLNRAEPYDGTGTHRLVGSSGTSWGDHRRLAIELDERTMDVRTGAPSAAVAAARPARRPSRGSGAFFGQRG